MAQKNIPDAKSHHILTLAFTGIIAASTVVYAGVSIYTLIEIHGSSVDTHQLAVAASKQFNTLDRFGDLQLRIARIQYGSVVNLTTQWMGFTHIETKVFVRIAAHQEQGKAAASRVEVATRTDILPPATTPQGYSFAETDFVPTDPGSLPPYRAGMIDFSPVAKPRTRVEPITLAPFQEVKRTISPEDYSKNVYVWGKIRYKDLTPDWIYVPFCRYISLKKVMDSSGGNQIGGTGATAANNCEIKTDKSDP